MCFVCSAFVCVLSTARAAAPRGALPFGCSSLVRPCAVREGGVRPHVQTRGPLAYTTKGAAGEQIDLKRAGGRCSGQHTHLWARHRGAGQPRVVKTLSAPSRVVYTRPRVDAFAYRN